MSFGTLPQTCQSADPFIPSPSSNLITTVSPSCNSLLSLELGYLVQETLVYLAFPKSSKPPPLILMHHIVLSFLLLCFFKVAQQGKEKGAYFLVTWLGMNASTIVLHAGWWLREVEKTAKATGRGRERVWRRLRIWVDWLLVGSFAGARMGL